jgi:hypothetical protein
MVKVGSLKTLPLRSICCGSFDPIFAVVVVVVNGAMVKGFERERKGGEGEEEREKRRMGIQEGVGI